MKLSIQEIQQHEAAILKEVIELCKQHKIDYFLAYGSVLGAVRHHGPIPWDSDIDIAVSINQMDHFIATMREGLSEKYYLDYFDTNKYYPFLFPRIGMKGYSTNILHIDIFNLAGIPNDLDGQKRFKKKILPYNTLFKYKNIHQKYGAEFSYKGKIFYSLIKLLLLPVTNGYIIRKFKNLGRQYPFNVATYVMNINGGYGEKEFIPKALYGKGCVFKYSELDVNIPEQYHKYLNHFYGDYMKHPPKEEQEVMESYEITKF